MEIQSMIGRIGAIYDNSNNNKSIVKISVAQEEYYNRKKNTTWFNFTAFNQTADFIIKNFDKGDLIFITSATIKPSNYTKDNANINTYEMIINSLEFVPNSRREKNKNDKNIEEVNANDIPF